ncbi:MAG: hypothetical protein KAI24_22280 [Planctomycetes bacterium]|nr:hypothetical protein [Planctomycetota bacterium]
MRRLFASLPILSLLAGCSGLPPESETSQIRRAGPVRAVAHRATDAVVLTGRERAIRDAQDLITRLDVHVRDVEHR